MAKKFLTSLGLVSLASDPTLGTEGELYYNNVSDGVRLYKNGAWTDLISTGNLPSGGTSGQILAKTNNTDYNVEWIENFADYTEVVKLKVKNDGTRALYKGQPVYVTGANGTNVLVGRSSNVTEGGSSKTIGILAENLATNGIGYVVKEGKLGTLDTSAADAVGDPVWLGVDGALIYGLTNKPYAPAHLVYLGVVTKKNGSTGEIFVQVQNGFEIRELHDVAIGYSASIQNNEILAYNSASSVWTNQSPSETGIVVTDDLLDYLTLSSASSTYLTQTNASSTYQIIGSYLTSESDPVFAASEAYNITSTDTGNWDTAYSWGNHSSAGYLTTSSASSTYLTQSSASTNYQPKDADLTAIAGLTSAADALPYFTGSGTASTTTLTTYGRSLIDDADAATARTTLGLGTMAIATATDYLTTSSASSTYAPLSGATFTGDIAVNGGDITTTSTNATLYNTNATNINIGNSASAISIGNTLHTGTTTINNNLEVTGTITFGSGSSTLSSTTIQIDDTLISLSDNNTADILDIGLYAGYTSASVNYHTGLVRDASDSGIWKLFSNIVTQPTTTVDFTSATYDILKVASLQVSDASTTRTNLGLTIGTNVQAYSATLSGINTLGSGTGFLKNTAGTWSYDNSTYLTTTSASTTYAPLAGATFTGNIAINNSTSTALTTTGTTAALFNTTATTLNIGGAATTLAIGASTGTTTINNNLSLSGAVSIAASKNIAVASYYSTSFGTGRVIMTGTGSNPTTRPDGTSLVAGDIWIAY